MIFVRRINSRNTWWNIILLDKNDNLLGETAIIPYPLEVASKNGKAKVLAEYKTLKPSCYFLKLEGFEKGEEVTLESVSGPEKMPKTKIKTDQSVISILNGVEGQKGGISQVIIERASGEKMVLELPWGNEILAYVRKREKNPS